MTNNIKLAAHKLGNKLLIASAAVVDRVGYGTGCAVGVAKYGTEKAVQAAKESIMVDSFKNGYMDGKEDAYNKCVALANIRAANRASRELMEEFMAFDDSMCGDGAWNGTL